MKKEKKLDKLYSEFETEYSNKSKEEMDLMISSLEKEITGKESTLERLDDEKREQLSQDIKGKKQRLENLKGYTNNKNQIEGIRKFKASIEKKLEQQISIRDESFKLLETANKEYKELIKKLSDEKYTMSLDNEEYNNLLAEKAKFEKEREKEAEKYMQARDRVIELQGKIGKCDMAWKTLFTNKGWDEIQRRAVEPNSRFTRKVNSEKAIPISAKKRQLKDQTLVNPEERKISEELSKKINKMIEKKHSNNSKKVESTALVAKKENLFRRIWNKISKWMNGSKNDKKDVKTENAKQTNVQEESIKEERDTFLEGLRQHVDLEYKTAVKEAKDVKYRETHKVQKPKENEARSDTAER